MIDVYCVLWGDKYSTEYPYRLRAQVERNLTMEHRFLCVTHQKLPDMDTVEPPCDYPGWWQKVGLFRPGFAQNTSVFLDLDVVITDELDSIIEQFSDAELAAPLDWSQGTIASAFMVWNASKRTESIWNRFASDVMDRLHGDQNWIDEIARDWFTEIEPPVVRSYKWHCRGKGGPPEGARVICFHGKPDPDDVLEQEPWVKKAWLG